MNLDLIKSLIKTNVYHIPSGKDVPLHRHSDNDEIFYCIKGEGYGLFESGERQTLSPGKAFIVPAGVKHTVKSDTEIYVCSFLIPKTE